ncbi:MAG: sn-glycerol-3-phosphate ABC transporter substrate-binding protein UgpB [Cytophagales bacterium]|nr:sn-glycerol-3-phosphate ABC transporter substrate-binding protein UgpB [Cytophagales bacterium]
MKRHIASVAIALSIGLSAASSANAQTQIQWWHSMTGAIGDWVGGLANEFNASQKEYKVVPVFKGSYDESYAATIAAYRAGNAPHIVQIFEVGTASMMASKAIKPVTDVFKEGGIAFDSKQYVPAVAGYYTAPSGAMLSFPFNSSTTVFFYNKDMFKKHGLDPNHAPTTWPEVAAAAAKLKASGEKCGFTPAWQSWTQLESFSTWHNTIFATKNNGFDGWDARLAFNSPLHVRHIENLANMQKQGLMSYAGRRTEAEAKFWTGECAMLTSSSAAYAGIKRNAKFEFGIAPLPYYPDVAGAPQNTVIGGGSLWAMAGKTANEYKGVALFYKYLSDANVQAKSSQLTGYLPLTNKAYEMTKASGFYDKNPGTDVAVKQMIVKTTAKSRGIRLGNFVQVRNVIDEELEAIWAGKKTAKEGLDAAVSRGNELLEKFEKAQKAAAKGA